MAVGSGDQVRLRYATEHHSPIIILDGGAVPQALLYIQETFELTILQARTRRQIALRISTQF